MALQPINYGTSANDGTGDSLREAMRKAQGNFEHLEQAKADAQATTQALAGKVTSETGKSLMTDAERAKLSGIQSGASNDRSTHTGEQAINTVTGLQTALDAKASDVDTAAALGLKADKTAVAQAIAMATTFTAVPTTFQAWLVVVTLPHFRLMQWNGVKYVRSPIGQMPGEIFHSDAPPANIKHGIQLRSDVMYNTADHPDLAEVYGFVGPTFVLKDGRARVIRSADLGRGIDAALVNGYLQEDAIRNISGTFGTVTGTSIIEMATGVFYGGTNQKYANLGSIEDPNSGVIYPRYVNFDASRQVPTASENRVKSLVATAYVTR